MHKSVYWSAYFTILLCLSFACNNGRIGNEWIAIIDPSDVQEGEGQDDIPSIDTPNFTIANEVNYLSDSSLVLGILHDNMLKAYPLDILQWHEVVNDVIGNTPIAITYATLTGSGVAFERISNNGVVFQMGVTGLLYNSNSIYNDRLSGTFWLQILGLGVRGLRQEQMLQSLPVIEVKWSTWQTLFPNSEVLNTNTGFNRPYQIYPYGDYLTNDTKLLFDLALDLTDPLDSLDNPIPFKEKGLGVVIQGDTMIYPLSVFPEMGFDLIEDKLAGEPILVVGSQEHEFITAFSRTLLDGTIGNFDIADTTQLTFSDQQGAEYDIFGKITNRDVDFTLNKVNSKIAFWFSWAAWSYPNRVPVYE